jgi:hypothetical protein
VQICPLCHENLTWYQSCASEILYAGVCERELLEDFIGCDVQKTPEIEEIRA